MNPVIMFAVLGGLINGMTSALGWYLFSPESSRAGLFTTDISKMIASIPDPNRRSLLGGVIGMIWGAIMWSITGHVWLSNPASHIGIVVGGILGALVPSMSASLGACIVAIYFFK